MENENVKSNESKEKLEKNNNETTTEFSLEDISHIVDLEFYD